MDDVKGSTSSQEGMLPLLPFSNSTWGSSQGFLQWEAGTIWRFLLPATVQQENARSKVLEGSTGSALRAVAAQSMAPMLSLS